MSGFLSGQLAALKNRGFGPVLCAPERTDALEALAKREGVDLLICAMRREISPLSDIISYLSLVSVIRRHAPEITVTLGPKAALLGGLAAATCQVPCRIQTKWGIRLETTRGLLRAVLILADKVAAACAHLVLCDSPSGRDRTIELGLAPTAKVKVVASGSANGIDIARFDLTPANKAAARAFREKIGVGATSPLVGFVGRISRDKGLAEMLLGWRLIRDQQPEATLVLVGADECHSEEEREQLARLLELPGVKALGPQSSLERIFPAFDILLLPSHREGFGVVVLEAGAVGVPTVGFLVTGMRDSVVSGETGQLVAFGDVRALAKATCLYLENRALRDQHGEAARRRVRQSFRQEQVWHGYAEAFKACADSCGLDTSGINLSGRQ